MKSKEGADSGRKIGLMFFANFTLKAINVIENLALVPFFISAWGISFYGEWLTITAIPAVLALANFGIEVAVANMFVVEYNLGNRQNAQKIFNSGFTVLTLLVIFLIFIVLLAIYLLSIFGFFSSILIPESEATLALTILMFSRLLSFYHEQQNALFLISRKANVSTVLKSAFLFGKVLFSIFALMLSYGVVAIAVIDFSATVFILAAYYFVGKKYSPTVYSDLKWEINNYSRDIFRKGMAFFAIRLWMMLYFQGSILIVRFICGPAVVAAFNTVRVLTRAGNQAFNIIGLSVFPEIQFLLTKGAKDKARKVFLIGSIVVFSLAIFVLFFLGIWGIDLYEFWTNGKLQIPDTAWMLFIIGLAVNSVWSLTEIVYRSFNKPEWFSVSGIISSILALLAIAGLSSSFGLDGIAFGCLLFECLMALLVVPKAYGLMDVGKKDFLEFLTILKTRFLSFVVSRVN